MINIETIGQYEKEIISDIPVLVEIRTASCSVCRNMSPVVEAADKKLQDKAKIVVVDGGNPALLEIAKKLEVFTVPAFILFKKGREKARYTGALTEEKILEIASS